MPKGSLVEVAEKRVIIAACSLVDVAADAESLKQAFALLRHEVQALDAATKETVHMNTNES